MSIVTRVRRWYRSLPEPDRRNTRWVAPAGGGYHAVGPSVPPEKRTPPKNPGSGSHPTPELYWCRRGVHDYSKGLQRCGRCGAVPPPPPPPAPRIDW